MSQIEQDAASAVDRWRATMVSKGYDRLAEAQGNPWRVIADDGHALLVGTAHELGRATGALGIVEAELRTLRKWLVECIVSPELVVWKIDQTIDYVEETLEEIRKHD